MLKLMIIKLQIEPGKMFWQSLSYLSNTAVRTDYSQSQGQSDQRKRWYFGGDDTILHMDSFIS